MKTLKILTTTAAQLFALLTLVNCSDDIEKKSMEFSAEVSGKAWIAEHVSTVAAVDENETSEVLRLIAENKDNTRIELSFDLLELTPRDLNASVREKTAIISSFTGYVSESYIQLSWSTDGEENVSYFEVLRSYDNSYFEPIEWVSGHGTTDDPQQYYTWIQFNPDQPYVYCKLRVSDYFTNSQFSETLKIKTRSGVLYADRTGRRFGGYDGKVELSKYDVENRLVSGTFHFKFRDEFGEEKEVVAGRFDNVRY